MENVEMIQMLYEAEATVYLDTATIGNGAGRVNRFRNICFQTDGTGSIQVATSLNHSA